MATAEPTFLAFDLGASSGRAILGTLLHDHVALREVHRFSTPLVERGDHLFWDIAALWGEIRSGLAAALRASPDLQSVSMDSWAVDYVPIDSAGRPLRDPYAYRDPRTRGRMAQALQRVPAAEIYRRTGIQMLEINTLYQLLADLDDEPELLRSTACRLPIADYLLYRLSGRAAVERTMASTTQLLNVRTGDWDRELIGRFGLPETGWPEVIPAGSILGALRGTDGPDATPPAVIASCSHDTAAAVAAVPVDPDGPPWAYLSSGTWSLLGVELREPILTDAAREANFTNEAGLDGTIRFLKNLTGLWVLQECERAWREEGKIFDEATLIAEAVGAAPPAVLLDLDDPRLALRGNMPTKLHSCCRDLGARLPRTRGALVRLILESLAASYGRALRQLEGVTSQRIRVLHVVGGGSRNSLLCQLTANACGCLVIAGPAEATALGNLLVQARTLGLLPARRSIREIVRSSSDRREYLPVR